MLASYKLRSEKEPFKFKNVYKVARLRHGMMSEALAYRKHHRARMFLEEEDNIDGCATYPLKIRREGILSTRLSNFKEFTSAIDAIEEKGVVMAIASSEDIETASLNDF
nr:presequence protease 2 [Tanacetum cinerariifolium]